jgi:hypothetical protein
VVHQTRAMVGAEAVQKKLAQLGLVLEHLEVEVEQAQKAYCAGVATAELVGRMMEAAQMESLEEEEVERRRLAV